jgi:hypothetical protein
MAEQDVTGRVVMRVQKRVDKLRQRITTKIPYGPDGGAMAPQELRLKIQNMDPAVKMRMMQTVGIEEWSRIMEDLYSG